MDQQQYPVGSPEPLTGNVSPQGAPGARLEPIGETWANGVGPVRLSSRSSRFRWAIALGIVLCVALVTAGGAYVLSGAGGAARSLTAGNAPKGTLMFVDLRTDLPGDQHQKLADFMSHFPGFKDRAQFDSAFDDILNRITGSISPDLNYTSAFKSWTTGELSVAVTSLGNSITATPPSGAVIVALKDRTAGQAWVTSEVTRTGTIFTAQDYAGTKLYVAQTATAGVTAAYAFTDRVLLLGMVDAVKAGLDAPSKGSLADDANYKAAMGSLSGDSVASFYLDAQSLMTQATSALSGLGGIAAGGMSLSADSIPAWLAGSVRAESDHMAVVMTMPKAKGALSPGNRVSALAPDLPGSTFGVFELHSVGQLVNDELKAISDAGGSAPVTQAITQVKTALSQIGGVDWIGDADLALTRTGSIYSGGLVVKTTDSATAAAKKAMITNLIALAGGSMGITSTDETYKGTTITMVSVPNGSSAHIRLGIATKGDLLVAGYEDSFVKAVIDTTPANSLAAQSDYNTVMSAVGASNSEYGYFNVSAVADEIGQSLSGSSAYYNLNYKPYVDHIGGAAFASVDGSTVTVRFVFTAK